MIKARTRYKWNESSPKWKRIEEHLSVLAIMAAVFLGTWLLIGTCLIVWVWWALEHSV